MTRTTFQDTYSILLFALYSIWQGAKRGNLSHTFNDLVEHILCNSKIGSEFSDLQLISSWSLHPSIHIVFVYYGSWLRMHRGIVMTYSSGQSFTLDLENIVHQSVKQVVLGNTRDGCSYRGIKQYRQINVLWIIWFTCVEQMKPP